MTEAKMIGLCQWCGGTGIEKYKDANGNELTRPCTFCGADGKIESPCSAIDTTAIMAELDYIHGKVTAIWNKIKD